MKPPQWAGDAVDEAVGRRRRIDPVQPRSGGPAGNARLTAWLGLALLVLSLVELVTLVNLDALINWHIVVGVLLVPPALVKTASTGWRIARYYAGGPAYVRAGPPPLPLRVLGPLVVLFTLAVLGSGLALVAVGPSGARTPLMTPLGLEIDVLTIHQATFVAWAVVTGLHTLGRMVPAMRILTERTVRSGRLPGGVPRGSLLVGILVSACVAAALVFGPAGPWMSGGLHHGEHRHGHHVEGAVH